MRSTQTADKDGKSVLDTKVEEHRPSTSKTDRTEEGEGGVTAEDPVPPPINIAPLSNDHRRRSSALTVLSEFLQFFKSNSVNITECDYVRADLEELFAEFENAHSAVLKITSDESAHGKLVAEYMVMRSQVRGLRVQLDTIATPTPTNISTEIQSPVDLTQSVQPYNPPPTGFVQMNPQPDLVNAMTAHFTSMADLNRQFASLSRPSGHSDHHSVKLPRITLPEFSGARKEWDKF